MYTRTVQLGAASFYTYFYFYFFIPQRFMSSASVLKFKETPLPLGESELFQLAPS